MQSDCDQQTEEFWTRWFIWAILQRIWLLEDDLPVFKVFNMMSWLSQIKSLLHNNSHVAGHLYPVKRISSQDFEQRTAN